VFEDKVLRRIFGPKRENGDSCTMRSFIICTNPQISLGRRRMRWTEHGRGEKSVKGFDHSEGQGVGGRMGSEWILGRLAWGGGALDSTGSG
jgi:hypothetical protein